MTAKHTLRLLEASAAWARLGGHDHRTIRDQFNECADTLRREVTGEDVKLLVDERIEELDAAADW